MYLWEGLSTCHTHTHWSRPWKSNMENSFWHWICWTRQHSTGFFVFRISTLLIGLCNAGKVTKSIQDKCTKAAWILHSISSSTLHCALPKWSEWNDLSTPFLEVLTKSQIHKFFIHGLETMFSRFEIRIWSYMALWWWISLSMSCIQWCPGRLFEPEPLSMYMHQRAPRSCTWWS